MIPTRNVYYMLSYSFTNLKSSGYRRLASEDFENAADLLAAIILKGVASIVKHGKRQDYKTLNEEIPTVRGRIDTTESSKPGIIIRKHLVCSYDVFSADIYANQIIKSVMLLLLHADIAKDRKKKLRSLLTHFSGIETLDVRRINWHLHYDRNNQTYRMLIGMCSLVVHGLIQSSQSGETKLMKFLDDQTMSHLYEKFILQYYHKEFPYLRADASYIRWQLDDDATDFLPSMKTDVTLTNGQNTLILDAKYYSKTLQENFDKKTIHSANLYQIFTYVKNKEKALEGADHQLSGLLLYAKTDETLVPNAEYRMSGNRIGARTLDLNEDFSGIKYQLNKIARDYLEI